MERIQSFNINEKIKLEIKTSLSVMLFVWLLSGDSYYFHLFCSSWFRFCKRIRLRQAAFSVRFSFFFIEDGKLNFCCKKLKRFKKGNFKSETENRCYLNVCQNVEISRKSVISSFSWIDSLNIFVDTLAMYFHF